MKDATSMTRGQRMAADVSALLRARNALLWVVTREEARVEALLFEAAAAAGYATSTWDVANGTAEINGTPTFTNADPGECMRYIGDRKGDRRVWIMRDLPAWLQPPAGAVVMRQLRNLARQLPTAGRNDAQAIIVLSPTGEVPPELAGHATVIEWPLPDREEIAGILDAAIEGLPDDMQAKAAPNGTREAAIDAAVGLSGEEAASCYARSLVQCRRIDPTIVSNEKRRVIARERILEWYDPIPGGLDAVGGLETLKGWLNARKSAYTRQAREYGLPAPRGTLLVGVPGCGKSLTAKAIATAWGVPLLRVDLGGLKSKFVGESEGNLRKAFRVIEAIGRCVVWFDEIEKALQGATSGSADGGVSSDALGAILGWMQERQGDAFVVATANDVEGLPPELLRKGRFDELFFVDVPNAGERAAVLEAAIRGHNAESFDVIDYAAVARQCDGFTGAEIAAIVPDAMFMAFNDGGRKVRTMDLKVATATVVPLTKTASEKIERLRKWAAGRARPAGSTEVTPTGKAKTRALDVA
jgi:AAA+ superfamily predicted ATPase